MEIKGKIINLHVKQIRLISTKAEHIKRSKRARFGPFADWLNL
jgi:hypothetical protein